MKKLEKLKKDIAEMESVIVAFSGGVDSTFLLKIAHEVLGDKCIAVTAGSASIPAQELEDTKKLSTLIGAKHIILHYEETKESSEYSQNPINRCYHCKHLLFSKLREIANKKDIKTIIEGSNASDMNDHRPGMQAARKLGVQSPLKEAELTKDEIRALSKQYKLPTHDKPQMACLASRIPYGSEVTILKLKQIDKAEEYIKTLGIKQLRVRHFGKTAKIEVEQNDIDKLQNNLTKITQHLQQIGFENVKIDPKGYRRGAMNEGVQWM